MHGDIILVAPRHHIWISRCIFAISIIGLTLAMLAEYQDSKPALGYLQLSRGAGKIYSPERGTVAELHVFFWVK